MSKNICTDCKKEAFVRYSNVKGVEEGNIVGEDESICTECLQKRTINFRIF